MGTTLHADKILDLGEKGCSRLLGDITDSLQDLAPGKTLLVLANDPAAPLDIKVWCRQTGNILQQADIATGQFLIQKKVG
ncbi:sulfurtransferase TusA family protein [Tengunoibacter tsumagoiensis]|uniref:UPF0033 domain-containing protein n=1 Tax=Tengunoibacter tsumagoiensis TaxID=2014871 RepID=A0A402A3P3_9CHLR|nr:sulfurtransferase TusA family protein [Tengunoibacter tsumagoiensis]GCE13767.1 hypothetical protein KTT_36260 [Tengunoibacter tsumagoiensis]